MPALRLGASMARVMPFRSLRQETLAPALASSSKGRPPAFGPHPRAKSMLAFASAFRGLECAFHGGLDKSAYGKTRSQLVNYGAECYWSESINPSLI